MSSNELFAPFSQFGGAQIAREQLVRDAQRMVRFAAEPVKPGESIGAQIRKASNELRLHYGAVRRAWYGLSGPEIYPSIYQAWCALIERRARQQAEVRELAKQLVEMEQAAKNVEARVPDQDLALQASPRLRKLRRAARA